MSFPAQVPAGGLLERSEQLAARISDFQAERDMVGEARRYHTRADELERPAAALRSWLPVWRAFRQEGIPVALDQQSAATLRRLVVRTAEDFEQHPQSLLEANAMLKRALWDPLGTFERDFEGALTTAWCAYVENQIGPRQNELLDVLVELPDFRAQVVAIRALYEDVELLKRTLRPGVDVTDLLGRPLTLANRITAAISQLRGSGIPAEVLEFIKQASSPTGAPYASFTDAVRDWFAARGLLNSLRLRLGGAG